MKKTHRIGRIGFLVTSVLLLLGTGLFAGQDVPRMTVEELQTISGNPDVVILDVRGGRDWQSSAFKIQGALRADPEDYLDWADTYPKSDKIVLYCA